MKVKCKLKAVLDERGLSQLEVANGAGVTPGAVGRMYRNQLSRLDFETVDKVTDYLGITEISELFELSKE
jgi:transcriptional regulator with XRE-family HTH domain